MPTSTHDWVPPNGHPPRDRASSPFGDKLARVHGRSDEPERSTWPVSEKASDDILIPRSTLEKIYLSPPIDVKGQFRNIFANPTPLGLVGFLVATLPVAFSLMGIRGAGGGGAATGFLSLFFGGMLQLIACSMEFLLGNTFSFLVFGTFGAAWLALACTSMPMLDTMGAFTASATTPEGVAAAQAEFYSSFAFGLLTLGFVTLTFGFCALRTNIIFVFTFALVSVAVFLFAGSYWALAEGNQTAAAEMQKAVGAIFFIGCLLAWYLLVANLLEVLEFGISLPVGDLSTRLGRIGSGKARAYRDRSTSV